MHFCRGQRNSRKSVTNHAADQTAALLLTPAHDLTFTFYQIIPKTLKALRKSDKEFSVRYLKSNITQFSEVYSNVSAYDFTGREALDLLKEIEKIDRESYFKIISGIDRDKVLNRWDQFSGISPRKKQWVKKRKTKPP